MKVLKIIGIVVIVVIFALVAFMAYMGMFSAVEVKQKEMGPYKMAYQEFIGPYAQTKVAFDNVYKILTENGIENNRGIGIYYDDPSKVEASKLRSDCGSIIEKEYYDKLDVLNGKVKTKDIAKSNALVVQLPIKNVMSYMFGPMKAYPALMKHAEANNIELADMAYEVYDMPEKVIYYVFQIK